MNLKKLFEVDGLGILHMHGVWASLFPASYPPQPHAFGFGLVFCCPSTQTSLRGVAPMAHATHTPPLCPATPDTQGTVLVTGLPPEVHGARHHVIVIC